MNPQTNKIQSYISQDFLAVSNEETVNNTIEHLKSRRNDFQDKFAYVYVVDKKGKLLSVLQTRDLLMAEGSKEIASIMKSSAIFIGENSSFDDVVHFFCKHNFFAAPVVDKNSHLKGVISYKSIEPFLSEERKREITGEKEEIEASSAVQFALKRLPWLSISITTGLICAYILGLFIGKIESVVALILFVPIIIGIAGNVGAQSAKITNRGLDEGKLSLQKIFRILWKEFFIGVVVGLCAFLLIALISILWRKFPLEGIALGLSIVFVSTTSGIFGVALPVMFRVLKIKSDFASNLLLLLICDTAALVVYFLISLSFVSPVLELT